MKSLAMRMPFLLVCIAGLALVAIRWRRHPRASLLALLGVVALFLSSLGTLLAYEALPRWMIRWQGAAERGELVYSTVNVLFFTIDALGLGLLLAAVFAERSRNDRPAG